MATIILGSGIIGVSTAYYLSLHPSYNPKTSPIYLIEATSEPFQSASGYSGGFLAKDWFSPATASLGELSFRLHRELADQFDGKRKWGYAKSTALSMSVDEIRVSGKKQDWLVEGTSRQEVAMGGVSEKEKGGLLRDDGSPAWITPQEGGSLEVISSDDGCAQVEPWLLCDFLRGQCEERGVKMILGARATDAKKDEEGRVRELCIKKKVEGSEDAEVELGCKNVLIAAGAWTPRVFETLFPESKLRIPIEPLAGYSIVVRSPRYTLAHDEEYSGAHSVFCAPGQHWKFAPEAISRTGREGQTEIYVAGLNSSTLPLPELATDLNKNEKARKELRQVTVQLSGASKEGADINEDDLEVVREGLCFRPVAPGGKPILCMVRDDKLGKDASRGSEDGGVFVAAGHGPWGISLSLGTGKVMSELILGEKTSARIDGLGMR
jgi:glycine/D-amino acid oxidase-like deaminating enzyme